MDRGGKPPSVNILKAMISSQGKPFTIVTYPEGAHGLRDSDTGKPIDYWPDIFEWYRRTVSEFRPAAGPGTEADR